MSASVSVTVQLGTAPTQGILGPASSISNLDSLAGGTPADGTLGFIRTGSSTDQTDITLVYNATRGLWVSDEFCLARSSDTADADISGTTATALAWNYSTGLGSACMCSTSSVRRVNDAMNAGLGVEHRMHAWLTSDRGGSGDPANGTPINFYFMLYALSNAASKPSILTTPPPNGWAQTATMTGGAGPSSNDYAWAEQAWTTLTAPGGGTLSAPSSTSVIAVACGYANTPGSGTIAGNGNPIDMGLFVRFVG